MDKWKTIKSNYIYQTPFGNLRDETCELPDGKQIDHYYVQENPEWINAVVLTKDNLMIFVKQYRQAVREMTLEIPGGNVEPNESLEKAILREVREETGYTTDQTPIKLGEFMVNPATNTNNITTYLLMDAYQVSDQSLDSTEDIKIITVHFNEVEALIQKKHLRQLFSAHAYLLARDYLNNQGEL